MESNLFGMIGGLHFRKSNTEPIMRIYAEAPDKIQAEKLVKEVKSLI